MKVIAYPAFKTRYKNPYNWLLYTNMIQQGVEVEEFSALKMLWGGYDILHLHWVVETIVRHPNLWIGWLRATMMLFLLDLVRMRGTKVVVTIHDETPHSVVHPQIAEWFKKRLCKRVDSYISLSELGGLDFKCEVIRHGHYRDAYPNEVSRDEARKRLGIVGNCPTILFFGYIDFYKNVPHLVKVFRQLSAPDYCLVVAGKLEQMTIGDEILSVCGDDNRIKLFLEYIDPNQVQMYFNAADLVVLPFKEILNSGSAILALSFDVPILVPDLGGMRDLQAIALKDWVKIYSGELTPEILQQGLDWALQTRRCQQVNLDSLEWSHIAQKTIQTYENSLYYKLRRAEPQQLGKVSRWELWGEFEHCQNSD